MWEYEKLSQRSKNVLLDPGIAIYLEEWLFMEKLISLIKKREKFKGQKKN